MVGGEDSAVVMAKEGTHVETKSYLVSGHCYPSRWGLRGCMQERLFLSKRRAADSARLHRGCQQHAEMQAMKLACPLCVIAWSLNPRPNTVPLLAQSLRTSAAPGQICHAIQLHWRVCRITSEDYVGGTCARADRHLPSRHIN